MDGTAETFVLEFSYPAKSTFGLPITDVVDTFFHVFGPTTVKPDIIKGMLPLWLHGHQKGDPDLQEAALGPLRSSRVSFVWPWFIDWLEHFRSVHLLPRSWEPFADQVKDRRLGLREERVPLLADVLSWTVYNRQNALQHATNTASAVLGRTYVYELIPGCEAAESLVAEQSARLVPGDWRTYPPYFPGDRTSVRRKVHKT